LLATATGIQADGRDAHALRLLFRLLIRNHREMHMRGIAMMYEEIYRVAHDIARVKVTTAVPLSPVMHDKVEAFIRERAGTTLEFTYKIDPAIVGGIILEVGSQRYDASVSQKLREIRAGFLKK
jgi:F-type H+-transporting ATPase subunit delta